MSVNKVILLGNCGSDPLIRSFGEGDNAKKTASFTLATSEWAREGSEWKSVTEWHNINVWGKAADTVERKVRKGVTVYVEGKIRTREYTTRDGEKRTLREIAASVIEVPGEQGQRKSSGYASNQFQQSQQEFDDDLPV